VVSAVVVAAAVAAAVVGSVRVPQQREAISGLALETQQQLVVEAKVPLQSARQLLQVY